MTLIRLIWRRISRVVSMLLIGSPLRRIALVLGWHLRCLLLLRRNSGTSRPSLGLPRNGRSLVGWRLTGGRCRRRRDLRCPSAVTSGRRRLLVGWRRMGLACGRRTRRWLTSGRTLLLLLLRRRLLLVRRRTLRRSNTSDGSRWLIRTAGSLSRLTGVSRIAGVMAGQRTGWSSGTSRRDAVHWRTATVLEDVRRRKKRLDVVLRIGQVRQIDQIAVQRHVVRHALVRLAHVLEVLDGLDEAGVLVQDLLDVHRTRRRRRSPPLHRSPGATPVARVRRLLGLLLLRVSDRHVCLGKKCQILVGTSIVSHSVSA